MTTMKEINREISDTNEDDHQAVRTHDQSGPTTVGQQHEILERKWRCEDCDQSMTWIRQHRHKNVSGVARPVARANKIASVGAQVVHLPRARRSLCAAGVINVDSPATFHRRVTVYTHLVRSSSVG